MDDNLVLDIVDLICRKFVDIRFYNGSLVNLSAAILVAVTDFPLSNMKVVPVIQKIVVTLVDKMLAIISPRRIPM